MPIDHARLMTAAKRLLVNLLFHYAALLVSLVLAMHDHGYTIAGVVLGLCLLPLGYLAYRSPRAGGCRGPSGSLPRR